MKPLITGVYIYELKEVKAQIEIRDNLNFT